MKRLVSFDGAPGADDGPFERISVQFEDGKTFTAHFDTSTLEEHGHGLRAIVTGKNGASLVLEDSVMIDHD